MNNDFLISTSCTGRSTHPGGSISFRSTNNKVFVDVKPLVLLLNNPVSDNILIINCNFKIIGNTRHPCISAKWRKYFKKILVNGHNIIIDELFGKYFAADNVSQDPAIVSSNSIQKKSRGVS